MGAKEIRERDLGGFSKIIKVHTSQGQGASSRNSIYGRIAAYHSAQLRPTFSLADPEFLTAGTTKVTSSPLHAYSQVPRWDGKQLSLVPPSDSPEHN